MPHPEPVVPHTFVIKRTYPHPRARVWSLLATPESKRRWFFGDDGTAIDSFEMDFRVGGRERASYTIAKGSPVDGMPFVNDGTFHDIAPNERIVMSCSMSLNGRNITVSLVTYELAPDGNGTAVTLTHQAVYLEGSGGPEMRQQGWNALLDKLGNAASALPQ